MPILYAVATLPKIASLLNSYIYPVIPPSVEVNETQMLERRERIHNFEQIRCYVLETLSKLELLKSDCCHLAVRLLTRAGRPCGVYFCLYGPRAVRLSAIWETRTSTILFYDSSGQRFQKTQLVAAPQLVPDVAEFAAVAS